MVIFPEGTRSKTGKPKAFSANGLKMLYKFAPDAYFVPVTIENSWKMTRYGGSFPLGLGNKLVFTIHKALKGSDYSFDDLFAKVEDNVTKSIK